MRLIGAGLPRTATLSQKLALEMLGVGPCYHMVDVLGDLDRAQDWAAALAGAPRWQEIFAGYDSTVDWPGSYYYRELREAFPEAKLLLSVRSPESWARSMTETIAGLFYGDSLMRDLSSARARVDPAWRSYLEMMAEMWDRSGLLPRGGADEAHLASAFERYNAQVQDDFDDVVVWSPADGWEPICELLELPVPDVPFPRVNDSATFAERIVDSSLAVLNASRAEPVGLTAE
ncbi:MAG TPA: sulfotransferase [Gaiellaceae bacterium]|nr:sulfotransferase [Gaiellaceae bacterium]